MFLHFLQTLLVFSSFVPLFKNVSAKALQTTLSGSGFVHGVSVLFIEETAGTVSDIVREKRYGSWLKHCYEGLLPVMAKLCIKKLCPLKSTPP